MSTLIERFESAIPADMDFAEMLALYEQGFVSEADWKKFARLASAPEPVVGIRPPALIECWNRGGGKSSTIEFAICYLSERRWPREPWREWFSRVVVPISTVPMAEMGQHHVRAWDWFERLTPRHFVLYTCSNLEAANTHVGAIAAIMEQMGTQRAVSKYGLVKGWNASMLRCANGFTVMGFGLDSGIRGVKIDFDRPDVGVLDDIDRLDDSADETLRKIRVIRQTALPTGSNDCAWVFIQNKIRAGSIMDQVQNGTLDMLRDRMPTYSIPAIEGLTYKEVVGESGSQGLPQYRITGGAPTWAGKSIAVCQEEINTYGLVPFLIECQHDTGVSGKLLPQFSETKDGRDWHVCNPFLIPKHWERFGSHDYGDSPDRPSACFYPYAVDEHGDVYVVGEYAKGGRSSGQQAQDVLDLLETMGWARPASANLRDYLWETDLLQILFDYANTFPPEAASSQTAQERKGEYPVEFWWKRGLPCVRAVKDRIAGWRTLREWLTLTRWIEDDKLPEGGYMKPRFQIFRGAAPHLVTAITNAPADPKNPNELDPGFKNDDPLDSLRYGIMSRPQPTPKPVSQRRSLYLVEDEENANDRSWYK